MSEGRLLREDLDQTTKILFNESINERELAYDMAIGDLMLADVDVLDIKSETHAGNDPDNIEKFVYIATVNYKYQDSIVNFIRHNGRLMPTRIFKWGRRFKEDNDVIAFAANVITNLLNMKEGYTFVIESDDKVMRKLFFDLAVKINADQNLGCSFDYNKYDYRLLIRRYYQEDGTFSVITAVIGIDMQNTWCYDEADFTYEHE